jgi:hypothetical protein
MRSDMSKVIVERPRRYGVSGRNGRPARSYEDMPAKQGMKWGYHDLKELNENLRPLERYLHRNVGRPWNKVYSEICEHIRIENAVQNHVRGHLKNYVYFHVMSEGKRVFPIGFSWKVELSTGDLYLCPRTGILRVYKRKNK